MARVLELYFNTFLGGPEKLTVRSPKEDLQPADIKAAMDQIAAANVFTSRTGELLSPKSARYVDRNVYDIEF